MMRVTDANDGASRQLRQRKSRILLPSRPEAITSRVESVTLAGNSHDDVVRLARRAEDWGLCGLTTGWLLSVPAIFFGRFFFSVLFLSVFVAVALGTNARRSITRIVGNNYRHDGFPVDFPQEES